MTHTPLKTINTLIPDMEGVLKGNGGWDATITKFLSEGIANLAEERFIKPQEVRDYLSLSSVGSRCDRQLWSRINHPEKGEDFSAETLGTFFYGDILEKLVLSLAVAAGHNVTGLQERLEVEGVGGSGDAVIDGWVVDVKSASTYSFDKFKNNRLKGYTKTTKADGTVFVPPEEVDAFGYISQLSSYLYAYQDDPRVTMKDKAAFLVVAKERFKLCLDIYDMTEELKTKREEVIRSKEMVAGPMPPRGWEDKPHNKSGNRILDTACSYCSIKHECWPGLRTFIASGRPMFFTNVVKEPGGSIYEVK